MCIYGMVFAMANYEKSPKSPSTVGWVQKWYHIYTMECTRAKTDEPRLHSTKEVNLREKMLAKKRRRERNTQNEIPFMYISKHAY